MNNPFQHFPHLKYAVCHDGKAYTMQGSTGVNKFMREHEGCSTLHFVERIPDGSYTPHINWNEAMVAFTEIL